MRDGCGPLPGVYLHSVCRVVSAPFRRSIWTATMVRVIAGGMPMAFKCTIPAVPTVQQDDDTVRITRWDFEPGADPVQFGLVASLNRPAGNVTGVSFLSNLLVAKQLGLLQEFVRLLSLGCLSIRAIP